MLTIYTHGVTTCTVHMHNLSSPMSAAVACGPGQPALCCCCRAKANNEMQVGELKQMLQLCTDFSSMAEGLGCHPVASLRTAAQLQCKSYLEALHHHTLSNLTGPPPCPPPPVTPVALLCCHLLSYLPLLCSCQPSCLVYLVAWGCFWVWRLSL